MLLVSFRIVQFLLFYLCLFFKCYLTYFENSNLALLLTLSGPYLAGLGGAGRQLPPLEIRQSDFNTLISSSCSVIVQVSVVLKRTVGDSDWRFDNLSGRHLQSQWLWRWRPLRLSKRQSLSPTVLFRTTLTRTITLHELLILLGSNHLLFL